MIADSSEPYAVRRVARRSRSIVRYTPLLGLLLATACKDVRSPVDVRVPDSAPLAASITTGSLNYAGGAVDLDGTIIRLSQSGPSSIGAVWLPTAQALSNGFVSEFSFRMTNSAGTGGDGFAFVIQSVSATALGRSPLGYTGLTPSVAVEFDTRTGQGAQPHVAVHLNGDASASGSVGGNAPVANMNNGSWQTARIVYEDGTLAVFVNGVRVRTVTVNLPASPTYVGFTASSGSGPNSQSHFIRDWDFTAATTTAPVLHRVDVAVRRQTAPGVTIPVAGITVVATDQTTGEPIPRVTGGTGIATLLLPKGAYVFSVYPFETQDPSALIIWPSPVGAGQVVPVGGFAPLVVLLRNNVLGAHPKSESTLQEAIDNPIQVGILGPDRIDVLVGDGAIIQCVLIDANGNPSTTQETVFGIQPVKTTGKVPSFLPAGFPWPLANVVGLPKGFGFGVATSGDGCNITGAPLGTIIIETRPVNGKIYRGSANVKNSGDQVTTVAAPSPTYTHTNYFLDEPFGDGGPTDFGGAIVYGWEPDPTEPPNSGIPGDRFSLSTQFIGQGTYTIEIYRKAPGDLSPPSGKPTYTVSASCSTKKCSPASSSTPKDVSAFVEGSSQLRSGVEFGTVVLGVVVPNVPLGGQFWVRLYSVNGRNSSDRLANDFLPVAVKQVGVGNTFLMMDL